MDNNFEGLVLAQEKAAIDQSPIITGVRQEADAEIAQKREGYKDAAQKFREAYAPMGESDIDRDVIGNQIDLTGQAMEDADQGIEREPGEYSYKHARPDQSTVNGYDLSTGKRVLDTSDITAPGVLHFDNKGMDHIRKGSNHLTIGGDYETVLGATNIAKSVLNQQLTREDFEDRMQALHLPQHSRDIAWNAAVTSTLQADIEDAFNEPPSQEELDGLPDDVAADIPTSELPTNQEWLSAARVIWEAENSEPFTGTEQELSDWALNEMSNFNWRLGGFSSNYTGMAYYAARAVSQGDEYAQAFVDLMDLYDRVETDLGVVLRSAGAALTDVVALAGGAGVGKVAAQAASKVAKDRLRRAIVASIVGGVEGRVYGAGGELSRQTIELEGGARDSYDPLGIGMASLAEGAVGSLLGPIIGEAVGPEARAFYRRTGRKALENARKGGPRIPGSPRSQMGAVGDLTGKHPSLEVAFPLAASKTYPNIRELKVDLQEAARSTGVDLRLDTPEANEIVKDMVVSDARYAMQSNANAIGWYDKTVTRAMNVLSLLHPEIKTKPDNKFAFTYALAVTSNGMKVDKNFHLAEEVYQVFKETGRFPEDAGVGEAAQAMNTHFKLFNEFADAGEIDTMHQLFDTKLTVGELKKAGYKVSGERMGEQVYGSAIIGPKIGNGFYSNLNGRFDQLTMDRWLRRTWGRLTGDLIVTKPELESKKRGEIRDALKIMRAENKTEMKQLQQMFGTMDARSDAAANALAVKIQKASMDPANRAIMNTTPAGEALRKSGNGLAKYLDGQIEAPTAAERIRIRGVFNEALSELQEEHPELTMADLQALLWYPEKRLYDRATSAGDVAEGYVDDEAPDYANAAAKLAADYGIDSAAISEVMQ